MFRLADSSRVRTAALLLGALLAGACHNDRTPPDKPPRRSPLLSGSLSPAVPSDLPPDLARLLRDGGNARRKKADKLAEKEIAGIREHELTLTRRRVPEQRIAFGRSSLGQLTNDALVVRGDKSFKKRAKVTIAEPRRLIVLADGSFLALGATGSYRLAPGRKKAKQLPRVTLFPSSVVFADRRDDNRLWVLHGFDETLYQYQLDKTVGSMMGMGDFVELKGFDHEAFAALKDGSFLYTTQHGFSRFYPKGKHFDLKALPGKGKVWRVLPTKRIDRVWVARDNGEVILAQLGSDLHVVRKIKLPPMLFDIASNDSYLAVLRVEQPDGGARHWQLAVYGADGTQRLAATLPPEPAPPPGEDWVRAVTRDRSVKLALHAPLVAVGGPSTVLVWNIKSGKKVLPP